MRARSVGSSMQAPTKATKRGWLRSAITAISARNSAAACWSKRQSFWCNIFTTTSRPVLRMTPRCTMATSPRLMHSPSSTSAKRQSFSGGKCMQRSTCVAAAPSIVPLREGWLPAPWGAAGSGTPSGKRANSEALREGLALVGTAVEAVPTSVGCACAKGPLAPTESPGFAGLSSRKPAESLLTQTADPALGALAQGGDRQSSVAADVGRPGEKALSTGKRPQHCA
mmetsp:Transcript_62693/g.134617  ORF Transcript_62693/g.134617 Transcript_62693/m.134617 type:complete len:226 (-) Transcript_62693:1683-2360(-)